LLVFEERKDQTGLLAGLCLMAKGLDRCPMVEMEELEEKKGLSHYSQ
jgi:hypothetical protein